MTLQPNPAVATETRLTSPPLLEGFPPEEFRARRAALRAACPNGIILLRGATEEEAHGTRYRQNSALTYLTGVATPGAFLVLLPEGLSATLGLRDIPSNLSEFLFLPAHNPVSETWTGPKLTPGEETEKATGIEKTLDVSGLWGALTSWLRQVPVVYTLTPYGDGARLTREYALMQRITDIAPVVRFQDCALALAQQRIVKSDAEIEKIKQAIAITGEGQRAARKAIASHSLAWEYEVEAEVFAAFRRRNAVPAFPSIVGAGANGTVLHYEDNGCPIRLGDLVVVDIGARLGAYCGDVTRTYPAGGTFTPRQREIYQLVLDAHQNTITTFKTGEDSLKSINDRCKAFLKESPLRAKDAQGKEQTMEVFMPHGLSHHLGLDVHDVGDREAPLPVGSVITIEPGIYIPSEGIGVRIEDDYLVTESGLECLGPPLEKDLDELEAAL